MNEHKLVELNATYMQEGDCCGGADSQFLRIFTHDGGGGQYYSIKTERWVFDNLEELKKVFENFFEKCRDLENI
jgi:hypothetical protein